MTQTPLSTWVVSCLLLGLRTVPVFVLAPPFSLVPMPGLVRPLFGLALSVSLVTAFPQTAILGDTGLHTIVPAAARELMLGMVFVLAFQIVFGGLYLAGRTIDMQAGYGFALLVDPGTKAQVPMVGTLFAFCAGAVFFGVGGHLELLRLFASSLQAVPLGSWVMPHSLSHLMEFISIAFLTAFGVGAASVLALFLIDMTIALMSRTVPQMNVLVLGFQAKTIALLLILPLSFGVSGALFLRLMTMALQAIPGMI